jgi:tetratricopeptide (TPR) repeat protein
MAEAIAVLGFVSSVAQIIQFSTSAVSRLRDFHSSTRDTPKAFRDIEAQLPLLTDAIRRTKAEAGAGNEATQAALLSVINNCLVQVKSLDEILKEALPNPGDSSLKRAQKAISSLRFEKEVQRITKALCQYIALLTFHRTAIRSEEDPRGSNDKHNDPGAPKLRTYNEVPHRRVPEFIGREQLLTEIELSFGREAEKGPLVVVLHGMGGQGKTQLALEYCRRAYESKQFTAIFWCDATSEIAISRSFEFIAETIKGPDMAFSDTTHRIAYVKASLSEWPHPWLIVFDNYDSPLSFPNIREYMPSSKRGAVLITSRHAACERLGSIVEVTGMQEEEALALLRKRANLRDKDTDEGSGKEIVRRLGLHPLAIDQAGAYISRRKLPLNRFIDHYKHRREIVLKETPALWEYRRKLSQEEEETSLSVFTTWELSFQQISHQQGQLLTLFAFLQYTNISEELFWTHHQHFANTSESLPEWMKPLQGESGCWDSYVFEDMLAEMRDLCLLQGVARATDNFCRFSLHPLVSDWIKLRTDRQTREENTFRVVAIIQHFLRACHDGEGLFSLSLQTKQEILLHMGACEQNIKDFLHSHGFQLGVIPLDEAGAWFAEFYHSAATRYSHAQSLYERVIKSREKVLAPDDPSISSILTQLSSLFHDMAKFEDAERLKRRVLEANERRLGRDDPATLAVMLSLASTLERQGLYAEAEKMGRRALEGLEKKLGKQDPTTLSSANNLARILERHGKYDVSEQLSWQVLEDSKKVLGGEHPTTLTCMNILSSLLLRMDKGEQAEDMCRRTLEGMRKVWGEGHRKTVESMNNLGLILESRGKFEEAEKIHRQVLEWHAVILRKNHASNLISRSNLSVVLQQLGKHEEAVAMCKSALEAKTAELGGNHPSTLTTVHNLSWILHKQGHDEEAEPLAWQALIGREKMLSKEHPLTIRSASNLVAILRVREKHNEADRVSREFGVESLSSYNRMV